jgi:hypothetical protein
MHDNSITINDSSGPCYRLPGSQIAGSTTGVQNRSRVKIGRGQNC